MTDRNRIISRIAMAALIVELGVFACSDNQTVVKPKPGGQNGDVTPPEQIVDPQLAYPVVGGDATLSWTAPRDDADNDQVTAYDIRYSYSFPFDWEISGRVSDPPSPAAAGTPQQYVFAGPTRGRDFYAAVRSVDAAGNVSPVSNIAHVRIIGHTLNATCVEATTNAPVPGLAAVVTARHVHSHVSDANGAFSQDDLTAGAVNVALRYGTSVTAYHDMNHLFDLASDVDLVYKMIPYEQTTLGIYDSILSMFTAATGLEGQKRFFKKWRSLPVDLYMPELVNSRGIDYRAIGVAAVERWEELTGIDLWNFVEAVPDTGVYFQFRTRAEMGIQVGLTYHIDDPSGYPLQNRVDIVNDFGGNEPLFKTMMHELGHTIRLGHLPAGYLMFGGQPLPSDPTPDEIRVVQLHAALPNGLDIRIYDLTNPDE